jgi:hypothetical protein
MKKIANYRGIAQKSIRMWMVVLKKFLHGFGADSAS